MHIKNVIAASGLFLAFVSGLAGAQSSYRLTDIGTLGGTFTEGWAINASGQITGSSHTAVPGQQHAFLWDGAAMRDLGTLGGSLSVGVALNASGQVTGYAATAGDVEQHAFLWNGSTLLGLNVAGTQSYGYAINDAGLVAGDSNITDVRFTTAFLWDGTTLQDLGAIGGSSSGGRAINASGQTTGYAYLADNSYHAFISTGATLEDLGTLGGLTSFGLAINDAAQVTGWAYTASAAKHAFLWDGASMQDLGTLGGTFSEGVAINSSGRVTGRASTASGGMHAFLWDGTTLKDLGTLGGANSEGKAINDSGQVTGYSETISSGGRAFLWNGSVMQDLNNLIDPTDPLQPYVTLTEGRGINAAGQIVANGSDSRTGGTQAYLVSPVLMIESFALSKNMTAGCLSVTGKVTLLNPAPAGGVVVTLSDTLGAASTAATLKFLSGATVKTFAIKTVPVAASENGTVTVSLGAESLSQPLSVRPMGLLSVALSPTTTVGSQPVVGTAKLECKAGPGPITVDLQSSQPALANPVATSIVVPQGLQSATFDVSTNPVLAKSTTTISGTANGITKGKTLTVTPAASASPTSLKFGSVTIGATSAPQAVTLTNKGTLPFSVTSVALVGTSASWFLLQNNCPANLPAGGSCTIDIQFKPIAAGSKSTKLSIATSATSAPLSVSLSGAGL